MPVTVRTTALEGVLILEPRLFADDRGWFFESFNAREFAEVTGVDRTFVQDNHSWSRAGVLRGMHYQVVRPQGKLVRVVAGTIYDVAVDLRRSSPTFRQWVAVELSAANRRQLWVPEGFAHGFLATTDAEVLYKTTERWYPEHDRSLLWSDPGIGITWPLSGAPILAAKDAAAPPLAAADTFD
jgi:dTDP-4-dehydrorhamnose 3,5-epimerase